MRQVLPDRWHALLSLMCTRLRRHPTVIFWLLTCSAYMAGVAESLLALAAVLLADLAVAVHVVNHTYPRLDTGSTDARSRPGGPVDGTLPL